MRAVLVAPAGVQIIEVEEHENPLRRVDEDGSHTFHFWAGPVAIGVDRVVLTALYRRADMSAEEAARVLTEWRVANPRQSVLWP